MIRCFRHKGLETFLRSGSKKGILAEHANRLARILDRLDAAQEFRDMSYPGSGLYPLSGDQKGQYAVQISGNWRVFFEFSDGDALLVDYDDDH
mgnify:FL=1